MAMTKKDQDALAAAGKAWTEANTRGDKAGMEAAHKQAESIRNSYGYSGGSDGSQYIKGKRRQQKVQQLRREQDRGAVCRRGSRGPVQPEPGGHDGGGPG